MSLPLPVLMALAAYLAHEQTVDCDCQSLVLRNSDGNYDCPCGLSW